MSIASNLSFSTATSILAGTAGAIVYQSGVNTTAFLSIGTNGFVLTSNGSSPTWSAISGLTAGNATTATNIAAGTAGQLHYQSAPGITAFAGPGTAGQILVSGGTSAPTYTNTGSIYVNRAVLADTASAVTNAVTFNNGGTGDASGTAFNGSAARTISYNTFGAMPTTGGTFTGPVTFNQPVTFGGTATYVLSTNTFYTDNIIEMHTPPAGVTAPWFVDDGKDIGFRFHYYANSTDTNAALVLDNTSKELHWYSSGAESAAGDFSTGTYGIFRTGAIRAVVGTQNQANTSTGALTVFGGVGVSGGAFFGGIITATNFSGSLSGGTAMSLVYQSAANTTAYLAAGTAGQILQTNSTGSAPTWVSVTGLTAGNATTSTNIAAGTAGQLVYQSAPGITAFAGPGTAGQILVSAGTSAPVYTNTGSIYVNRATLSDTSTNAATAYSTIGSHSAGTGLTGSAFNGSANQTWTLNTATLMATAVSAINLSAGSAMALPYQSASGTTAYLAAGTAGQILQTNSTGSAPTWVSVTGLTAGNATTATNIAAGTAGQLHYQSAPGITAFAGPGSFGQFLMSTGAGAPVYQGTLTQSGGNILVTGSLGIGTASPTSLISLAGGTASTLGLTITPSGWNNARHRFTVPTSGDTSVWSFNYTGSAVDTSSYATSSISVGQANIAFSAGATNTAPSTIATINTTGLGVGTTSPASIFHVRNGSLFPQGRRGGSASAFFFENATVSDLYLELANTVTNYSGVLFSRAATGNYGLINYNNATDNMVFYTAGAVQHTITSAGGFAFGSSQTAYGSSGQILQSNGNAPPTWVAATGLSAGTATTATQVNTVLQTANATYFPTFVDANNATALAESLHTTSSFTINPSTGFVGVGTTNATVFSSLFPARLAVQGVGNQDPLIVRTDPASSNAAAAVFHQAATTPGFDAFRITTVGTSATQPSLQIISGVTDATGAGGTSIFYVRQDGNVGIGTASPSYKLDVLSQNARIYSNSATSYALLRVGGTGSDSLFGYAGATNDIVTGAAAGDTVVGANKASANLRLTSGGGTINASLDSSGNLFLTNGISQLNTGFTNKLNINGSIVAGTATSTTGSIILQGQYGTGSITNLGTEYSSGGPVLSYGVYPSNAGTGAFFSSSGAALTRAAYTQAGNVHNWYVGNAQTVAIGSAATMSLAMSVSSSGINLPTPASGNANISFDGSTFTLVSNSSSAGLVLSTNSTERLRITSSGGVAFGGASNFGSSGQVLQSNGNAVPTWVSPTTLASASATNADNLRTIQQTASGTYYPAFVDSNNSTSAYEAFYTTSSFAINPATGRVGIGTSSPSTNLTIGGTAASGGAGGGLGAFLSRGVTTNFYEAFDGTKSYIAGVDDTQSFAKAGTLSGHDLAIVTGNGSKIYIQNSSGNVGIGTLTPNRKLHVQSSGAAIQLWDASTNGGAGIFFAGASTLKNWFIGNQYNVSDVLEFTPSAAVGTTTIGSVPVMVIQSGGNVGIGTNSPGAKFTINNAGSTSAAFYADIGNPGSVITLFEHTGASTPVPFRFKKSGYSGASPNYGLFYLHMNDGTVGNGSNLYFTLNNSASAEIEYGGLGAIIRSNTAGSEQGDLAFYVVSGGTSRTERMRITSAGAIAFSGSTNYGSSGQILQSNGNAAPTWVNASGITSGATSLTSTQVGFGSGSNLLTGSANLTYASSILNVAYQNTFNTSTPGFGTYGIHLNGQTTADSATGITFSAGGASAANANAGIYSQGSGSYGSKMYFATTDSYAVGSKTRMMIDQAGNVGIGTVAPISRLQVGNNTFSGVHGVYSNARSGLSVNGSLTSIVYASTYNDSTYPDYGMVFVHGPSTSNYNVWSISPDGPAKGSGLGFLYGASTDNIHVSAPKVYFQGSTGNVGIGTSAPDSRLHVEVGNATAYTPANTLVSGQTARISNTDGTSGVSANLLFVAKGAGGGNGLGSISGVNTGVGSLAFTFGTRHSSSNVTERMRITSDGNVGIGTSNPINKFEISGDAGQLFSVSDSFTGTIFSANDVSGIPSIEVLDTGLVKFAQYNGAVAIGTGTVSSSTAELSVYGMLYTSGPQGEIRASNEITAYFSSDARLKENIKLIENPITIIDQIRGVTFDWTDEHLARRGGEDGYFVRKHDIGVIAQEVQAVLPELVGTREDGYLAVKYEKLVPLLIEAIKAQQTTIETLTSEIKEIKDFLSSLKK